MSSVPGDIKFHFIYIRGVSALGGGGAKLFKGDHLFQPLKIFHGVGGQFNTGPGDYFWGD